MERRVIKFNLVGAICILILIIAVIIGLIVGIPKLKNKTQKNNNTVENAKETKLEGKEEIDQDKEYEERIKQRDGTEIISILKIYQSELGYRMKYDCNLFHPNKTEGPVDEYISLYSNTVKITVEKYDGDFEKCHEALMREADFYREKYNNENIQNVQVIDNQVEIRRNVGESRVEPLVINGASVFKRTLVTNEATEYVYCIKINEQSCYIINVSCAANFEENVLPIIDYMINTFEII